MNTILSIIFYLELAASNPFGRLSILYRSFSYFQNFQNLKGLTNVWFSRSTGFLSLSITSYTRCKVGLLDNSLLIILVHQGNLSTNACLEFYTVRFGH